MGDEDAAFLEATLPALDLAFNLARRCSAQDCDVEDLVQETYLLALRSWRARRRPDRVEPWLATICLKYWESRSQIGPPAESGWPHRVGR
jgi:DNA-directed RNA polymerase specialized sigma24 family protein